MAMTSLTHEENSLCFIALVHWRARCEKEIKQMEDFALNFNERADLKAKCLANIEASRTFIEESNALIAKLRK